LLGHGVRGGEATTTYSEIGAIRGLDVAIIADTHLVRADRWLPSLCVERIAAADLALHAGDINTAEALARLEQIGTPLLAVRGNVDTPEIRSSLPEWRLVTVDGVRIGMLHDAGPARGRLERLRRRFPDAQAVVFGHSHLPLHEHRGGFQIFNPGSPTQRRRAPCHTMGWARVRRGSVSFEIVSLDSGRQAAH
jgi:putative phosphoesterase